MSQEMYVLRHAEEEDKYLAEKDGMYAWLEYGQHTCRYDNMAASTIMHELESRRCGFTVESFHRMPDAEAKAAHGGGARRAAQGQSD